MRDVVHRPARYCPSRSRDTLPQSLHQRCVGPALVVRRPVFVGLADASCVLRLKQISRTTLDYSHR